MQPTYSPPYKVEDRITLARAYMDKVGAVSNRSTEPDIFLVASALWDSAKFQADDLKENKVAEAPLTEWVTVHHAVHDGPPADGTASVSSGTGSESARC